MTFTPDYIVCPGEILAEHIEENSLYKKDFAELCGVSAKTMSQIINGKARITVRLAIRFEEILGVDAQLWMNLETRYRIELERKK